MELYNDRDEVVATIKNADITHHGNNSRAPLLAKVTFSKIAEGKSPSLLHHFVIKDENGKKYDLQFMGETPKGSTFDLTGRDEDEIIPVYRYPIEIDKEYGVFVREKRTRRPMEANNGNT